MRIVCLLSRQERIRDVALANDKRDNTANLGCDDERIDDENNMNSDMEMKY